MDIIEDKENSLLNRKEVKIIVEADKNPNFPEALNIIAREFKVNEENIAIKLIKGKFGRNTFLISAFIYKSREEKEKFEKVKGKEENKETQTPSA
jgi:ribosomal protein S24E